MLARIEPARPWAVGYDGRVLNRADHWCTPSPVESAPSPPWSCFLVLKGSFHEDVPRLPSHPTIMPVLQQRQQRQRTRTREPCGVRGARRPARDPRS